MTKFNKLFIEVNQKKLLYAGYILALQLVLAFTGIVFRSLNIQFLGLGEGLWGIGFYTGLTNYLFLFLFLNFQEKLCLQNRYQLLPTTGRKLMFANHLGSSLIWILFILGQLAIDFFLSLVYNENVFYFEGGPDDWQMVIPVSIVVFLIIIILIPIAVTFFDFLIKTIRQILPFKINKYLLYVFTVLFAIGLVFVVGELFSVIDELWFVKNGNWIPNLLIASTVLFLLTIGMWFLSVGMYNKFVETKK